MVGGLVVVVGLVLVPLPGPGWAIVFAGVSILGTEFAWAERLAHAARRRAGQVLRRARSASRPVRAAIGVALLASLVVPVVVLVA